jgi:hypothetical protein
MAETRPSHPDGWSTNQRATDILADALTKGDVADLNFYTRGERNEDLVITITVRHRGDEPPAPRSHAAPRRHR